MNYPETLDYLFTRLPVYQRQGKSAYKTDLGNTLRICELTGNPERKFKSVHIAGTNGKGSTAHMLASVFQEAGYKTGLYTSPHLKDFRERIRINGEMIPEKKVISFVEKYKSIFEEVQPSFFEWTVGLAFQYFAEEQVDIAIVETGLGGRLDSTNVISPEVSVITNIALDHTEFLGKDLSSIAREKAGIIKKGVLVVIGEKQEVIQRVFEQKAEKYNSKLIYASDRPASNYKTDLISPVQQKNIKTVLSTIDQLKNKGWKISDEAIKNGIANIRRNTGLQGRWQQLGEDPLIICDVAHNEAGIKEVVAAIAKVDYKKLHFVFGSVRDKDIYKVLCLLPNDARYYFCQPKIPRALELKKLLTAGKETGLKGEGYPSVEAAVKAAKDSADRDDMIFIGGSTFVVAEAL